MPAAATPETLAPAAARLYEQWAHLEVDGAEEGYPWATLAATLAAPLEPLYALLTAAELPWGVAFDPEALATALEPLEAAGVLPEGFARAMLAWVGQFAGVLDRRELDTTGATLRLRETSGSRRGTPGAIVGAARQRLVGSDGTPDTATVILTERIGGSPYVLGVATFADETPDPAGTERDIGEQMPAGRIWTYAVVAGGTWGDLFATHTDWADVLATFPTWADVLADPSAT